MKTALMPDPPLHCCENCDRYHEKTIEERQSTDECRKCIEKTKTIKRCQKCGFLLSVHRENVCPVVRGNK